MSHNAQTWKFKRALLHSEELTLSHYVRSLEDLTSDETKTSEGLINCFFLENDDFTWKPKISHASAPAFFNVITSNTTPLNVTQRISERQILMGTSSGKLLTSCFYNVISNHTTPLSVTQSPFCLHVRSSDIYLLFSFDLVNDGAVLVFEGYSCFLVLVGFGQECFIHWHFDFIKSIFVFPAFD